MNANERLKLQEMIKANNVSDQTDKIRSLKHSSNIRKDVVKIQKLKAKTQQKKLIEVCRENCPFLFSNYTDIFNKLVLDEIDVKLFNNFIDILEKIENGTSDQHEASFEVGKILREIYIDSAVRKGSKLEKNDTLPAPKREHKQLSWRDYKIMNEKFQDYHV
tara:strand:+ start:2632 stop:3117 length:486 start_codon:yes stop_codon:yes gene_type:complete